MPHRPSRWLACAAAIVAIDAVRAVPAAAQVRLSTLDEVRREVAPGDVISVEQASGATIRGRVLRFGDVDLEIRTEPRRGAKQRQDVAIPLDTLRSLERPRDSSRNGTLIGAAIGGGFVAGMTVWAFAVDANEADECGPAYAAAGAIFTGLGALAGWAIDYAHSKPHVRFDAPAGPGARVRILPMLGRGAGVRVSVSY